MAEIRGTPFAPGQAQGVLRFGPVGAGPNNIVVVRQEEVPALREPPAGVVLVNVAPFSHPVIQLLGWGVPCVLFTRAKLQGLEAGREVIVDGTRGTVVDARDGDATQTGHGQANASARPVGCPVKTADGVDVQIRASIASAAGAARARSQGACSIGLVRSECLMPPDGSPPDAAFYVATLGELCRAAHPLAVTVRLLDVATDKRPAWLPGNRVPRGPLGLQGARLYRVEPVLEVVRQQIQALRTLAVEHPLRALVPWAEGPPQFQRWRGELQRDLAAALPVGAMAETPAALLEVGRWLEAADFVAVGCNDLMQSLFAVDRDLPELSHLLDPYAPVLYRFLREVAEIAAHCTDRIQLCGLLPQVQGVLPILLGLGYRVFCVGPSLVPILAGVVRRTSVSHAQDLARRACRAVDSDSVRARVGLAPGAPWGLGEVIDKELTE
jgi:phosphoenolpyruvate-protein kinase (PTS system EI component)